MVTMVTKVAFFLLSIFVIKQTTALSCYVCTASIGNQMRCENLSYSGGSIPYSSCFYSDAVCAKYVIEYGDSIMMHRGCAHRNICHELSSRYDTYYRSVLDCQVCYDHDYCNGAGISQNFGIIVIGVLMLAVILT